MYSTSAAYKTAIAQKLQQSRIVIIVQPKVGDAFTITDSRLIPKSVSYSNKASKNNDFSYGSVYVGEFSFTVLNADGAIDRYSLYDAKITPVFYQALPNNQEEAIPIGEFYVSEPKWNKKTIAVKCYDAMTRFDVPQVVDTFGTPFELLDLICTTCSVSLGMTEEEIEALPNGTQQLTMSAERVNTCRDAVSYIATVLCGFATIDRNGELVIKQFSSTANATIGANKRINSTIADYTTFFFGVKARFLQSGNWVKVSANVTGRTSGLILDLGDLPVVQGVNETLKEIAQTIANNLGLIDFTPSDITCTSDASIDLGDLIEYTNVNNTQDSILTPVTTLVWRYHGSQRLKGDGGNTRLNAVSDYQTKQIATVETDAVVNEYAMKVYTNSEGYTINDVDKTIVTINYSVYKDTVSEFLCTVPLTSSLDGNYMFTITLNNEEVCVFTQYVERGKHTITFSTYVENEANSQNRLTVLCHAEYYESDKRKQDAQIGGLIDFTATGTYTERSIITTIPSGSILVKAIKAVLFASGINTTDSWDGTLLIIDRLTPIELMMPNISVPALIETTNIAALYPIRETIAEIINPIVPVQVNVVVPELTESIIVGRKNIELTVVPSRAIEYMFNTTYINVTPTAFALRTDYTFVGVADTIDSGYLTTVSVPLANFDTVSSLTITEVSV